MFTHLNIRFNNRLGWIESSVSTIQKLSQHGYLTSGGGGSPISETLVESLLRDETETMEQQQQQNETCLNLQMMKNSKRDHGSMITCEENLSPLERNLKNLIDRYENKCNILCESLTNHGFRLACQPTGGYFVWVCYISFQSSSFFFFFFFFFTSQSYPHVFIYFLNLSAPSFPLSTHTKYYCVFSVSKCVYTPIFNIKFMIII